MRNLLIFGMAALLAAWDAGATGRLKVGEPVGPLLGLTRQGDTLRLPNDLRGKYVLVEILGQDTARYHMDHQFYFEGAYVRFRSSGFEWVFAEGEETTLYLVNPDGVVCAKEFLLRGSGLENLLHTLMPSVPMYETLSPEELDRLLATDPTVQLVDVRTPEEHEAGAIPNARLLNMREPDFVEQAERALDKSRPVAVYCKGGGRSRVAAWKLVDKGFTVYNLDKGYDSWAAWKKR